MLADDFIQFTIEHTDFVDYVFSSRNVKHSDLQYATLVDGLKNWLSNLAQSNHQMKVDISLQISRTSEVPRGFGKMKERDFGLQSKVKLNVRESEGVNSPVFDPDIMMDVQVPPPEQGSSLLQWDEERELFGSVPDNDGESSSSSSSSSGDDEYDDDSGTF